MSRVECHCPERATGAVAGIGFMVSVEKPAESLGPSSCRPGEELQSPKA